MHGTVCDDCTHYEKVETRILIIKLGAIGDVLRTTCILHGLKEKYPRSEISWITRGESSFLFENNELVDSVYSYESTEALFFVMSRDFDVVINLDVDPDSAALAESCKGRSKLGYGLDRKGDIFPYNKEAIPWLEMGAFDQNKKANTRSYQDLMLDICGLAGAGKEIVLNLSEVEQEFAKTFAAEHSLSVGTTKVGLNTGAGPRWQYKKWTLEGFEALIKILLQKTDATIILYGGPFEKERNEYLRGLAPERIVDTGTANSLRQFFSLILLSDLFITGDTMALHAAVALKRKVLATFGPTSAAEIDSYGGRVIKVQADLPCLVCYKPRCDFEPNCMNSISPERIFSIIQPLLVGHG